MLTITDIGRLTCERCKQSRLQRGVEVQTYGYSTCPKAEEPSPAEGTGTGTRVIRLNLKVWPEQVRLCLDCLKKFVAAMIDDGDIGLWAMHKQAAAQPSYVNAKFEEALVNGWI
jgi:hypothetical protein